MSDRVSNILLNKLLLSSQDIGGIPLKWMESFIKNRNRYVLLNNSAYSEQTEIYVGVTQEYR